MTMHGIMKDSSERNERSIEDARVNQRRTSHIEREITWAVVVLYGAIVASFAALHLYGHYTGLGG